MGNPVKVKPLLVSKLNTVAQIVLACLALAALAFRWNVDSLLILVMVLVAILTLLSVAFYLAEWVRHMNGSAAGH
jgi:cardiolipin synthase